MEQALSLPDRIERLRKALADLRPAYQDALTAQTVDDMVQILAEISSSAFAYQRETTPHYACFLLGQINEKLHRWYAKHHVIQRYHQIQRQLVTLETGDRHG